MIDNLADLDITPQCIAELRRLARLRHHDPHGLELADQTIDFLASYKGRDVVEIAKGWSVAAKSFRVLIVSGYPHQIFLEVVNGMLDEIARLTRRQLISRMLRGILSETETAEAMQLLNAEVDRHGIDLAGEIDAVENQLIEARCVA